MKAVLHYQIGDILGKGAFGSVFRGLSTKTGEVVAIKQLDKELLPEQQLPVLMRELEVNQKLQHPNIVRYIDHVDTPGHLYFILEFVEGGTLHEALRKFGPFSESLAVLYTYQVLKALQYLHGQGIFHRDIKGANILLVKDGQCKLADLGSAAYIRPSSDITKTITPKGVSLGSPFWMAPEIVEGSRGTSASDIWSLGCTVIEFLTGKPPYWALGQNVALFRMTSEPHPPLPDAISAEAESFLLACFTRDPAKRPSAEALLWHPWVQREESPAPHTQAQIARRSTLMNLFSGSPHTAKKRKDKDATWEEESALKPGEIRPRSSTTAVTSAKPPPAKEVKEKIKFWEEELVRKDKEEAPLPALASITAPGQRKWRSRYEAHLKAGLSHGRHREMDDSTDSLSIPFSETPRSNSGDDLVSPRISSVSSSDTIAPVNPPLETMPMDESVPSVGGEPENTALSHCSPLTDGKALVLTYEESYQVIESPVVARFSLNSELKEEIPASAQSPDERDSGLTPVEGDRKGNDTAERPIFESGSPYSQEPRTLTEKQVSPPLPEAVVHGDYVPQDSVSVEEALKTEPVDFPNQHASELSCPETLLPEISCNDTLTTPKLTPPSNPDPCLISPSPSLITIANAPSAATTLSSPRSHELVPPPDTSRETSAALRDLKDGITLLRAERAAMSRILSGMQEWMAITQQKEDALQQRASLLLRNEDIGAEEREALLRVLNPTAAPTASPSEGGVLLDLMEGVRVLTSKVQQLQVELEAERRRVDSLTNQQRCEGTTKK